jgi:Putative peptidoglycan binding domain
MRSRAALWSGAAAAAASIRYLGGRGRFGCGTPCRDRVRHSGRGRGGRSGDRCGAHPRERFRRQGCACCAVVEGDHSYHDLRNDNHDDGDTAAAGDAAAESVGNRATDRGAPSCPPPEGVGPGATGLYVVVYLQRLADLQFDPGPVDGIYGPATVCAVQTLHKLKDLPITGVMGAGEVMALNQFTYLRCTSRSTSPRSCTAAIPCTCSAARPPRFLSRNPAPPRHRCHRNPRPPPVPRSAPASAHSKRRVVNRSSRSLNCTSTVAPGPG